MDTSKNPNFVAFLRYSENLNAYISIYAAHLNFHRALYRLEF